jgi:hypothetical protein
MIVLEEVKIAYANIIIINKFVLKLSEKNEN